MIARKKLTYVSIFIGGVFLSLITYFSYQYISNLPKKVIEYEKVRLGMNMDEVMYNLGYPPDVLREDLNPPSFVKGKFLVFATKAEVDKSNGGAKDFYYWQYPNKDKQDTKRVDIEFDKSSKKVVSIGCYVDSTAWISPNTCLVNGIQALDTEETILKKLGQPSEEKIDGTVKTMLFKKFNMKVLLQQRNAYYIIIEKTE